MKQWNRTPRVGLPPARPAAVRRPAAAAAPVVPPDLYLRWALATGWRDLRRNGPSGRPEPVRDIRILARAPDAKAFAALCGSGHLQVPPLYADPLPRPAPDQPRFFTATVALESLPWLCGAPYGLVWELAMPLYGAQPVTQASTAGRYGAHRREAGLDATPLPDPGPAAGDPPALPIGDAVVVIDFGCPFLNPRFDGPDGSRIALLWDQDTTRPVGTRGWWRPAGAGYGRELDQATIRRFRRTVAADARWLDEAAAYRSLDYLVAYDDPRRRIWHSTHGGHVLDLAAGRRDPLHDLRQGPDAPDPEPDPAAQSPIVFVQLPMATMDDASGGSLGAQLLDGLRCALAACGSQARVVVNISFGTTAGPHDGSTLIEQALDQLLLECGPRLSIVLGAGNFRRAGCHVRRRVLRDKPAMLRFALTPDDTTSTFVEVWYPRPGAGGRGALSVRLRTAGLDWSDWCAPGESALLGGADGTLALLQHEVEVPHGAGAMVLVALAPTACSTDDDGPVNESGLWEIELRLHGRGGDPVEFDAWIERDDPDVSDPFGRAGQAAFVGLDREDQCNTLSSLATGAHTVVVGGYRHADAVLADYSSLPRSGGEARLVLAPCEQDALQPNLKAAAVRAADMHRANGTSVAAPIVARRLFNELLRTRRLPASREALLDSAIGNSDGLLKRLAG